MPQDGQRRGGFPLADSGLIVVVDADLAAVRFVDEAKHARLPRVAEVASRLFGGRQKKSSVVSTQSCACDPFDAYGVPDLNDGVITL